MFGICYRDKAGFLIGFDQESACARVHELVRSLVKERIRKMKLNSDSSSQIQDSRITYNNSDWNRESLDFNEGESKEENIMKR